MSTPVTVQTPKDQFLDAYEREHAITTRLLLAYPANKLDLRPAPKCKTARELAWVFVMERAFMTAALNGAFSNPGPMPPSPEPPAAMDAILAALDKAHR